MSISPPPPDTRERSLTVDDPSSAPLGTRSRSKKGPDYRLRGLDSAALKPFEAVARPPRRDKSHRKHRRRRLIGWLLVLVVLAGVAVALRVAVVEPFTVRSSAMAPTLQSGDRVVVVKATRAGPIKAGEMVVVNEPDSPMCSFAGSGSGSHDTVLRVIALPGQTIWSSGGSIYVNGKVLHESGWYNKKFGQLGSSEVPYTTVPTGNYYLMGDNRSQTCDSRSFGAVPGSTIVGKVEAILIRAGHPHIHIF
jgi:signal peptidase I